MRGLLVLLVLLVALTLIACGKKKPPGPPAYEGLCVKSCERVRGCHSEIDPEECRSDCISAFMPYGDRLRDDFVQEIEQCVTDTRCRDLGTGALDNSCRRDATERTAVSLTAIEMCEAINDILQRCTLGTPSSRAEACQQSFKILSDETLEEVIHCQDVECSELGRCFTAALGFSSPMPPVFPDEDAAKR